MLFRSYVLPLPGRAAHRHTGHQICHRSEGAGTGPEAAWKNKWDPWREVEGGGEGGPEPPRRRVPCFRLQPQGMRPLCPLLKPALLPLWVPHQVTGCRSCTQLGQCPDPAWLRVLGSVGSQVSTAPLVIWSDLGPSQGQQGKALTLWPFWGLPLLPPGM